MIPHWTNRLLGPEWYPWGFIWEKSATGGSQYDSHSVVEYAELVGKDNFKMACKDDRIWTKFLLFIYAKICVNVKCHLHHALFMVWLFSLGKKKQHVSLKFSSGCTTLPLASEWCGELGHWSKPQHRRTWFGHTPWLCLPGLILAGWKTHCLSFSAARNHACASPWIEGCAICKIPKDNFIYSCCKQCLYKVY